MIEWNQDDFQESDSEKGMTTFEGQTTGVQQGYEHGSLQEGLAAYYPFEKGEFTTAYDSALDNDGTINGATWTTSTNIGTYALSFDGTNDSILLPNSSSLNFGSGNFSISVWINTASTNNQSIVKKGAFSTNAGYQLTAIDLIDFKVADGSNFLSAETSSSAFPENEWVHVVGVLDNQNNEARVYINGVLQATDSGTINNTDNSIQPRIGIDDDDSSTPLNGRLNDLRFYDCALSQPEVEALYNLTSPSGQISTEDPRNGIVSEYKLDGDATDSVGTNDGTNNGVTFVNGYDGQAGDFDGSSDNIDFGSSLIFGENVTISLWINTDFSGGNNSRYISNHSGSQDGIELLTDANYINSDNSASMRVGDGTSMVSIDSNRSLNSGLWEHIVGIVNDSQIKLYQNGRLVGSEILPNPYNPGANNIQLGQNPSSPGTDNFGGLIDEVRIYNMALEPYEVETLYELGRRKINEKFTL